MKQLPLPLKFKEEKKDHWFTFYERLEVNLDVEWPTITWDSATTNEDDWRIIR